MSSLDWDFGDPRLPERFWHKVIVRSDGCWMWTGRRNHDGYGQFWVSSRVHMRSAHCVGYAALIGPVPDGLQLDHLCRRRACVNPAHLEPVTPTENWRRGMSAPAVNARKTHCDRGHPFDEANTYTRPNGVRECRICKRRINARYKAKRRASSPHPPLRAATLRKGVET